MTLWSSSVSSVCEVLCHMQGLMPLQACPCPSVVLPKEQMGSTRLWDMQGPAGQSLHGAAFPPVLCLTTQPVFTWTIPARCWLECVLYYPAPLVGFKREPKGMPRAANDGSQKAVIHIYPVLIFCYWPSVLRSPCRKAGSRLCGC